MRVLLQLALVLGGLSLPAAGAAQAASGADNGLATYTNAQYGFSLQYPSGLTPQAIDGAWSVSEEIPTLRTVCKDIVDQVCGRGAGLTPGRRRV